VLERLRERIRTLQAAPRQLLSVLRTGLAPVDGLLPGGGFPLGQVVELWGEPASGRVRLAFRAIAEAHRALRLAAWVDGPRTLYPPALPPLGVQLDQLLVVRPPEPKQLAWSALQLLRSGTFAAVGLDLTQTGVRLTPPESRRLVEAATRSGGLLLLLTPAEAPADGTLRLDGIDQLNARGNWRWIPTSKPSPSSGSSSMNSTVGAARVACCGSFKTTTSSCRSDPIAVPIGANWSGVRRRLQWLIG
jgi:hypothetical protein